MTRSLEQLWANSRAREAAPARSGAVTVAEPPALMHRVRLCVRAVVDWFTEY